jgi:putative tryptophan/tyrosine transport system substrate-binding protein
MRRRDFLALGTGALAWPVVARAQNATIPLIGYLSSNAKGSDAKLIRELQRSLSEQGFVEGKTVEFEFHWSEGAYDRLSQHATELVARKVDVIVASGLPATLAAQAATSTIPIVFRFAVDPVAYRVARSFDHPGGNLTGVTMLFDPLIPKKLQLLSELVNDTSLGFMVNPKNPNVKSHQEQAETAARVLRLRLTTLTASSVTEIEQAWRRHAAGAGTRFAGSLIAPRPARPAPIACRNSDPGCVKSLSFNLRAEHLSQFCRYRKPIALGTSVRSRRLRKQFCASLPRATFHTAWTQSGP